jgi:hypothetical protein
MESEENQQGLAVSQLPNPSEGREEEEIRQAKQCVQIEVCLRAALSTDYRRRKERERGKDETRQSEA